jgi:hypothetical protein
VRLLSGAGTCICTFVATAWALTSTGVRLRFREAVDINEDEEDEEDDEDEEDTEDEEDDEDDEEDAGDWRGANT